MRSLLFALLLSGSWAVQAADGGLTGVPMLLAQIEGRSSPIELEALDAAVRIHGFLAETTLVMTFYNRDPRLLEGEFLLTLPEGATVSGFGLDVEGVLVDGVVVDKQKGRIAFEREVRRQIDPGLIEWLGGNVFRTRVYPIVGASRRKIKVQYVAQLDFRGREAVYRLPLTAYPKLAQLRLSIEVVQPERAPWIARHPFSRLEPRREGDSFLAEATESDLRPREDFEIRLGSLHEQVVLVEKVDSATYAFAAADFADRRGSKPRRVTPERLAIFWDASFSRYRENHEEALAVVADVLRVWRPSEVALVEFRDQARASVTYRVKAGRSPDLLAALENVVYDGATSWRDLTLPSGFRADAALVFSDGRINFGGRSLPDLGVPAYVFKTTDDGDGALLRHLAERSQGAYFDLATMQHERTIGELTRVAIALRGVAVEQGQVNEIFAPVGRPARGATVVAGLMTSNEARLRLDYSAGDGDWQHATISLRGRPGVGLVSRFWAQRKLARLALFPEENHQAVLALGRQHGLVTPGTSLIVLETLDQYVEYQIEPPASLPRMRREYHEVVQDARRDAQEDLEDYLAELSKSWQAFLAWSRASYDFPLPGTYPLAGPQPQAPPSPPEPTQQPSAPEPVEQERIAQDPLADHPPVPQTVRGLLLDSDGNPLPGVRVTLESEALIEPMELYSGAEGSYQTPILTPGQYHLFVALDGFSTLEQDLWLGRSTALRFDFVLSAAVEETITVTSESPVEQAGASAIVLQPWTPEMPYLQALRTAPAGSLYETYLEQRDAYASSPAFYVDCSRFFFQRGMNREGSLIASNLLELAIEEPRLIRAAANLFLKGRAWDRAVRVFRRLVRLRPELPQSKRDLAVALILRGEARGDDDPTAARRDYARAASLLRQVALEPWGEVPSPLQIAYLDDGRFEEIGRIALVEYGWALRKLQALPPSKGEDLPEVDSSWVDLPAADLRIVLAWDDEFADMDLWVIEPSGEKVLYSSPRSAIGGLLSEDCVTGLGPETYILRHAMPGTYRILVNYFADSGPELLGPVTVRTLIATGFGREDEQLQLHTIRIETEEDTVEIGSITIPE